jgi:transposase
MNKRVYSAIGIRHVQLEKILAGREGVDVVAGVDVDKFKLRVVPRWSDGRFEKSWRVDNPEQIPQLIELLKELGEGRKLVVAMEPTGTYGEAFRQALADARIELQLVSGKRSHDYAEVFDGVPSQHDGKDAAVVAELCALGKGSAWRWQEADELSQRIGLLVDQMEAANQLKATWLGRVEGVLGRYWPEATRQLPLAGGTMMRALLHYGGPSAMVQDPQLARRLARFSAGKFTAARIGKIIACARGTLGVRQTPIDQQRVRWCAAQALAAHLEVGRAQQRLSELGAAHAVIAQQGATIGIPTACVLWTHLGDPRQYHCAAAYRKAMGLNLRERSSGQYQGQLKITKRGSGAVRQWLYLSALRLIHNEPRAKRWYGRKLRRGDTSKLNVITGLIRKLSMSMWSIVNTGEAFDIDRLLGPRRRACARACGESRATARKGGCLVRR